MDLQPDRSEPRRPAPLGLRGRAVAGAWANAGAGGTYRGRSDRGRGDRRIPGWLPPARLPRDRSGMRATNDVLARGRPQCRVVRHDHFAPPCPIRCRIRASATSRVGRSVPAHTAPWNRFGRRTFWADTGGARDWSPGRGDDLVRLDRAARISNAPGWRPRGARGSP